MYMCLCKNEKWLICLGRFAALSHHAAVDDLFHFTSQPSGLVLVWNPEPWNSHTHIFFTPGCPYKWYSPWMIAPSTLGSVPPEASLSPFLPTVQGPKQDKFVFCSWELPDVHNGPRRACSIANENKALLCQEWPRGAAPITFHSPTKYL